MMTINIRRIVTSHATDGKAVVGTDNLMNNIQQLRSGNYETLLLVTDGSPADVNGGDPTTTARDIEPPETGSIFRILELIPGKEAYMHRTDTIDYAICLSGKCEMYLDGGNKTDFNTGDVMVQRATMHGWANPYSEPCQIAFILIGSNSPTKHWHQDADKIHN
jgi:quercetin dioxygenase-like cupin family protein